MNELYSLMARHLRRNAEAKQVDANPRTTLLRFVQTERGQAFLGNLLLECVEQVQSRPRDSEARSLCAAVHEQLGQIAQADEHLRAALVYHPADREILAHHERIKRVLQAQEAQATDLPRAQTRLAEAKTRGCPVRSLTSIPVPRVAAAELSHARFMRDFAVPGRPVVITGFALTSHSEQSHARSQSTQAPGASASTSENCWSWGSVRASLGSTVVPVKRAVADSVSWARLEDAGEMSLADFLTRFIRAREAEAPGHEPASSPAEAGGHGEALYVHDWPLPSRPEGLQLLQGFTVPKYFAGDYLQHVPQGSMYRDSWPSLFVGPRGTVSALHIDAFNSNFWMGLLEGRKRWVFFPASQTHLLYPQWQSGSLDPVFTVDLSKIVTQDSRPPSSGDLDEESGSGPSSGSGSDPEQRKREQLFEDFPLLALVTPSECVLAPGEILFVPHGSPHFVENLDDTLAVSVNYIDESNFAAACAELRVLGLTDERAAQLGAELERDGFTRRVHAILDYENSVRARGETKVRAEALTTAGVSRAEGTSLHAGSRKRKRPRPDFSDQSESEPEPEPEPEPEAENKAAGRKLERQDLPWHLYKRAELSPAAYQSLVQAAVAHAGAHQHEPALSRVRGFEPTRGLKRQKAMATSGAEAADLALPADAHADADADADADAEAGADAHADADADADSESEDEFEALYRSQRSSRSGC